MRNGVIILLFTSMFSVGFMSLCRGAEPELSAPQVFIEGSHSPSACIVEEGKHASGEITLEMSAPAAISVPAAPASRESSKPTPIQAQGAKGNAVPLQARKAAGRARLASDREANQVRGAVKAGDVKKTSQIAVDAPGMTKTTPVLPLMAPAGAGMGGECDRQADIDRLTLARQNADNPDEKDRLGLDLAAAYVGAGQPEQARALYESIVQQTQREALRETAQRNLQLIGNGANSGTNAK